MINDIAIELFRKDLELRRIELLEECTTGKSDQESFVRACTEILYESGMFVDEPEILLIDEAGYRVDSVCWPDKDQPIVEFLLFIKDDKPGAEIFSEIKSAFNKTTSILRSLPIPTKRAVPEAVDRLIRRVYALIPSPESILVRIITTSRIKNPVVQKKFAANLNKLFPDIHTDVRLCDIEDLCTSRDGAVQGPTIEIDEDVVRCFLVHEMNDHDVYLAAFPGHLLAEQYRQYGQRLLQKNVRAFLGLRGKRNQKIQETIIKHPERFLAYNNGLTITVSGIVLDGQNSLKQLVDTQIVNGGQTIAILTNEFKANLPECLSSVMVMAKIIHVKNKEQNLAWIESIAETSNTQNAIKDADLSSRNPIYGRIKEISCQAFFRKGSQEYKWYFSRVRNQYEAELAENTKRGRIELKKFDQTYPKAFSIDKGIVGRVETIFALRPWISSRGEAKYQADFLDQLKDGFDPDLIWYRKLIAKVILVRHTTALARDLEIGEGRSCIVEYACAILSQSADFLEYLEKIRLAQEVPSFLNEKIKYILQKTHGLFIALGTDRSIKEHAKREETWKKVMEKAISEGWNNAR